MREKNRADAGVARALRARESAVELAGELGFAAETVRQLTHLNHFLPKERFHDVVASREAIQRVNRYHIRPAERREALPLRGDGVSNGSPRVNPLDALAVHAERSALDLAASLLALRHGEELQPTGPHAEPEVGQVVQAAVAGCRHDRIRL